MHIYTRELAVFVLFLFLFFARAMAYRLIGAMPLFDPMVIQQSQ